MPSEETDPKTVELFRQELTLCGVTPGEKVAVIAVEGTGADRVEGFLRALTEMGAVAFSVPIPAPPPDGALAATQGASPLGAHPGLVELLCSTDMVIDLIWLAFSDEQFAIQAAGTRILSVLEPLDVLRRLLPDRDLKRRVQASAERLAAASELHITGPGGTDVVYRIGEYRPLLEYGFIDEPGGWGDWPSGFVATMPNDSGVEGTVVLAPGTMNCMNVEYLREPVHLTIERGSISSISGPGGRDNLDSLLIRTFIESFDDERGYAVSHIGWGLNEKAMWNAWDVFPSTSQGLGVDGRSFSGNVLFSTGPNDEFERVDGGRGTNNTPCHLDLALRDCSLRLDAELIVDRGHVVPDDLRVRQ